MQVDTYLLVSRAGAGYTVSASKTKRKSVKSGAVEVHATIELPDELFTTPKVAAKVQLKQAS